MAHNKYAMERGLVLPGQVPEADAVRVIDQQLAESINGDEGGTWTPSSPITIGGSGVSVDTYGEFGVIATGFNSQGLILGDNDYPILSTPRSRTLLLPVRDTITKVESYTNIIYGTSYDEGTPGVTQILNSNGVFPQVAMVLPSYRLVNGSTLSSVTLTFKIGSKPITLPTRFLGFRVVRIPISGNYTSDAVNELYSTPVWAASTDFRPLGSVCKIAGGTYNGWIFRLVATTAPHLTGGAQPAAFTVGTSVGLNIVDNNVTWQAESFTLTRGEVAMPRGNMVWSPSAGFGTAQDQYWNYGRPQTLTMTTNQNNVIDTTTYVYAIVIYDAYPVALNYFTSVKLVMNNITDMRPVA